MPSIYIINIDGRITRQVFETKIRRFSTIKNCIFKRSSNYFNFSQLFFDDQIGRQDFMKQFPIHTLGDQTQMYRLPYCFKCLESGSKVLYSKCQKHGNNSRLTKIQTKKQRTIEPMCEIKQRQRQNQNSQNNITIKKQGTLAEEKRSKNQMVIKISKNHENTIIKQERKNSGKCPPIQKNDVGTQTKGCQGLMQLWEQILRNRLGIQKIKPQQTKIEVKVITNPVMSTKQQGNEKKVECKKQDIDSDNEQINIEFD